MLTKIIQLLIKRNIYLWLRNKKKEGVTQLSLNYVRHVRNMTLANYEVEEGNKTHYYYNKGFVGIRNGKIIIK